MNEINHEPTDVMCTLNNFGLAKNSVRSRGVSRILDQKIFWKKVMENYIHIFVCIPSLLFLKAENISITPWIISCKQEVTRTWFNFSGHDFHLLLEG